MTAAKSDGRHIKATMMRMDKQRMQYLLKPRSKWQMLHKLLEIPK